MCIRPTPTWQKSIGDFFGGSGTKPEKENRKPHEEEEDDNEEAGGSGVSKTSKKYVGFGSKFYWVGFCSTTTSSAATLSVALWSLPFLSHQISFINKNETLML